MTSDPVQCTCAGLSYCNCVGRCFYFFRTVHCQPSNLTSLLSSTITCFHRNGRSPILQKKSLRLLLCTSFEEFWQSSRFTQWSPCWSFVVFHDVVHLTLNVHSTRPGHGQCKTGALTIAAWKKKVYTWFSLAKRKCAPRNIARLSRNVDINFALVANKDNRSAKMQNGRHVPAFCGVEDGFSNLAHIAHHDSWWLRRRRFGSIE